MQTVVVVIVEEDGCLLGVSLGEEEVLTLIAVASENPGCWDDRVAYWPRYHTPSVSEFADSLALERVDFAAARDAWDRHESWVVIDLVRRRIITGSDTPPNAIPQRPSPPRGRRWPAGPDEGAKQASLILNPCLRELSRGANVFPLASPLIPRQTA